MTDPAISPPESLDDAVSQILDFREARDWGQYHTPEHLSRALSIEAGELEEEFLWKSKEEVERHLQSEDGREAVREEVADVLIYALLLCERLGIDPLEAIRSKLEKNREKYPVEQVRGRATISDGG